MPATEHAREMALVAAAAADDKLATDIVLIDVSERLAITDVFVIITGNSDRQVGAIVDEVEEKLRGFGEKPIRREGHRDGRWVLLDYADVVVHVQQPEERVFYALERLWKDCPVIPYPPGTEPAAATPPDADDAEPADGDDGVTGAAEVAPVAGSDD